MNAIIELIIITLVPVFELRGSIPYGLAKGMSLPAVFLIAVITNIALGMILYFFIEEIVALGTKINFINKLYQRYMARLQEKMQPLVQKYGTLAIAVFIGIPLPGSGVYSGALAAYVIGMRRRDFFVANAIGVVIAGSIVTLVAYSGITALNIFVKTA